MKAGWNFFFHLDVPDHEPEISFTDLAVISAPPSLFLVSTERNEEMEQVPRCFLKASLVQREFFSDKSRSSG